MKKPEADNVENRKARLEMHNRMVQRRGKSPEPSVLGSSCFSCDLSLNSLSLKAESEDMKASIFDHSSRLKKPLEVLYECMNSNLSEKDQKIIRLMAERREAKMKEAELAAAAKNIWEEERVQQARRTEERKKSLVEYLTKMKRVEELESFIKRNDRNENSREEKTRLESKINEKHGRVERRQKELQFQKNLKPEILSAKAQVLFHQELKRQRDEKKEAEKILQAQMFEIKEKKCLEKLERLLRERDRKLSEERKKRELKCEAAKSVRDELNRRYEEEQLRNLRQSKRSQAIREERVRWATEWRRKIVTEKNEREKREHALIFNRLKEEEMERLKQGMREIQAKDSKMKILREKRESEILRSRYHARSSAYLRQKIRSSYHL